MICKECDIQMKVDANGVGICPVCSYTHSDNPKAEFFYNNSDLMDREEELIPASAVGTKPISDVRMYEPPASKKFDTGKLRYSLIPPIATKALAQVLTFGAEKYAPNDWMNLPNAEERYLDALMRHLELYRSGEKIDPESGFSHLAHAITNVAFLIHFEEKEV